MTRRGTVSYRGGFFLFTRVFLLFIIACITIRPRYGMRLWALMAPSVWFTAKTGLLTAYISISTSLLFKPWRSSWVSRCNGGWTKEGIILDDG